jgi:hypothetical protein
MTVRNVERFVAQAVESVLGQTLRELELIVVDDASSDGTPDILSIFARRDSRVRIHRHDTHLGIPAALNLACRRARAPLIARLDGDDVAVPDRLERQTAHLARHDRLALVGGAAIVIDDTGRPHHRLRPPADVHAQLLERNVIIHSTVTLRRDALERVGGYRARFAGAEDYDLWLRLAERYQLGNLTDALVHYRIHPGQLSHQALEQQVLSILAVKILARRRRAGVDEGPAGDQPVTRADLAQLGVTPDAVQSALGRACLDRAVDLGDLDQPSLSLATLASTPGFATSEAVRRRTLARYHSLLARRRWHRGQFGRSLASVLRAIRARPALLGRLAGRWIRPARNAAAP